MSMIIGDSHDHEPDNKFQFDRAHKGTCQTLVGRFCLVDSKTYHSTMNPSKTRGVSRHELLNYPWHYQIN